MVNDKALINYNNSKEDNPHKLKVFSVWFTKNGRNNYQNYVGMSEDEIHKGWETITLQDKRYKLVSVVPYNAEAKER